MSTSAISDNTPELLWQPSPERMAASRMAAFRAWLRSARGIDLSDYHALWRWSVSDIEGFWGAVADFFDVTFHTPPKRVLPAEVMPGAEWFRGATLNYAEHALRDGPGRSNADLAVLFTREDGHSEEITFGLLRSRVAAVRAGLMELGVRCGDRVAALAPNTPATLVAFLAAASLGATWSSCSPELGTRAVAACGTTAKPPPPTR